MKRALVISCALLALAVHAASSASTTVRPKSDIRIWQTAMHPSDPLSWPWEGGADSAVVSLSNRMTGAVSSTTVEKSGDELRGACPLPVLAAGMEAFYAATLTLFAGGSEVASYSADVACVNGVAGRPSVVQDGAARAWRRVSKPRLAAYDAAWLDETTNALSSTLSANGGAAETLPGTSGYLVLKSEVLGDVRFDLGFDDDPDVWTAFLRFCAPGYVLLLR